MDCVDDDDDDCDCDTAGDRKMFEFVLFEWFGLLNCIVFLGLVTTEIIGFIWLWCCKWCIIDDPFCIVDVPITWVVVEVATVELGMFECDSLFNLWLFGDCFVCCCCCADGLAFGTINAAADDARVCRFSPIMATEDLNVDDELPDACIIDDDDVDFVFL